MKPGQLQVTNSIIFGFSRKDSIKRKRVLRHIYGITSLSFLICGR